MKSKPSLLQLLGALASLAAGTSSEIGPARPSPDSARHNARHIFNAVHSAMRQWGSSLHHNGMSFFPATVPEGVLLYHGTLKTEAVTGMEWLAFEIEHAESFARPMPWPPGEPRRPPGAHAQPDQAVLQDQDGPEEPEWPDEPWRNGYLHTYRVTRPQRLLYIDGMSAGKSQLGTLDTQDILLRNRTGKGGFDEWPRAEALCEMAQDWQIDGIIRMEAGFEVIKCNFSDGMELVSANQRPWRKGREDSELNQMEYLRAVAHRYWDIGASRVVVDLSQMVSAFFYPINLTNPDPEFAELPRLVSVDWEDLTQIKEDVAEALSASRQEQLVQTGNWQGVTDMIVSRYADRLQFMAERATSEEIRWDLNGLLDTFVDYADAEPDMSAATRRCTEHYLGTTKSTSFQDELIRAALETVSSRICTDLFRVQAMVSSTSAGDESTLTQARAAIQDLMDWLSWAEWRKCGPCQADQVCFVAIWPFGDTEDHYSPSCLNKTQMMNRHGYWRRPGAHGHMELEVY